MARISISSVTTVIGRATPSETMRVAPRHETTLSRTLDQRVNLAPRIAAGAFTLSIVCSVYFGLVAKRESLPVDTGGFTVVAGLFVGALAIERLTELLIAPWVGSLERKTTRNIFIGSVASLLGVLVAGGLGLYLMETLSGPDVTLHTPGDVAAAQGRGHIGWIRTLDVFVTGMAIAGGTKPLHDLISGLEKRTQRAKETASDATVDAVPAALGTPYELVVDAPDAVRDRTLEVIADIKRIIGADDVRTTVDGRFHVTGQVQFKAGSDAYVRGVYDLAYTLAAAGYATEPQLAAPAELVLGKDSPDIPGMQQHRRWALDQMNLPDDVIEAANGGAGVKVGHPDTGFRVHRVQPNWDVAAGYDFIDNDSDAFDEFLKAPDFFEPDFVPIPGHGTGTASVISCATTSAPDGGEEMYCVAPRATIIPYRVMRGPVHLFDSDVAEAVQRAVADGCDIISMSLGGFGFSGLRDAIRDAVESGVIVVAAGGNLVGVVVSPADYPETIAVASSTASGKPYVEGSSQGPAITITAPGTGVWRASFQDGAQTVQPGTGTSYATAHVAGVAALWLSKHRAALDAMPKRDVPRLFAHLVKATATPWPESEPARIDFGAGVINARALLDAPIAGTGAPTATDLDKAFSDAQGASALESTIAIGANLFTGEGTNELRVGIVGGILKFLGAEPALGKDLRKLPVAQRQDNVRNVVEHEAAHHYRTDPAFRDSLAPDRELVVPDAATAPLASVIGAINNSGHDAVGAKSKELRKALRGNATVRGRYRWFGLFLLILSVAASIGLAAWYDGGDALRFATSTTVLITGFYIAAQALERVTEYTVGRIAFNDQPNRQTERALILLGATVLLGCLFAGLTGFRLLDLLAGDAASEFDEDTWSRSTNVLVTGLAIAGGTKPLHDLLTRIRVATTNVN